MADSRSATLLDCTIRDGSYAIDFKFTAADTALIAGLLDQAGLRWIEVGHGLGLGASERGHGRAGSRDIEVIERTRERVRDAKIGVFFIPGIGTEDDLRAAAGAGLDFVRIGQNADQIEQAMPFIELARELGVEPFVNFMKTYGIAPEQFAAGVEEAGRRGVRGGYVVDSAGGMMPHEVAAYVTASLERSDVPIGFHGHSNLHLAVANSIAAVDAGAELVDTSVWGIGRSSGNVPTEVMAAVFDRLGVETGVDAMRIVDLAESYLRPLAEHLHPHDMTAVSLGYGRFHSSYLPKATKAARDAGVNPFRLIVELGRRDVMRLSDELLEEVVAELREHRPPEQRSDLARFSDPRFGPRRIANRPQALPELLDGMDVVAAKRHVRRVLDLALAPALEEEVATAEFVLEDDHMALGRLRFGSLEGALEALAPAAERIDVALLDLDRLTGGDRRAALTALRGPLSGRLVLYRSGELQLEYLGDVALAAIASQDVTRVAVADPETFPRPAVAALETRLRAAADVVAGDGDADLVVVAGPSTGADYRAPAICIGGVPSGEAVVLAPDDAYRDALPRWLGRLRAAPATAPTTALS